MGTMELRNSTAIYETLNENYRLAFRGREIVSMALE
jgi:hypothetical protein